MPQLPKHHNIGLLRSVLSALAIATASGLLFFTAQKIWVSEISLGWWLPLMMLAGVAAMDFLSGLIHWAADTWGSERLAVIGQRILHPFRVHHLNPDDILLRRFVDVNGDTALLILPLLISLQWLTLNSQTSVAVAVFLTALAGAGLFTNQVHQWAHQVRPPTLVRMLQRGRLILPPRAHSLHHQSPYNSHYCITTGWCNQVLAATGFFIHMERVIIYLTGMQPRYDDRVFQTRPFDD